MASITESIDSNDVLMNEAFEHLTAFINSNRWTNRDIKRSNRILKNLTKQIWTNLSLFKRRYSAIAKNKGMAVVPMDKKFIDEFLSQIKTDPDVIKAVYESTSKEIRLLDNAYKGVRTRKIDIEEFKKRLKSNNVDPTKIMAHVINSIALETTLKYMDKVTGGLDFDSIDPNNKRKALGSMNSASKGVISSIVDGFMQAAQERGKRT